MAPTEGFALHKRSMNGNRGHDSTVSICLEEMGNIYKIRRDITCCAPKSYSRLQRRHILFYGMKVDLLP